MKFKPMLAVLLLSVMVLTVLSVPSSDADGEYSFSEVTYNPAEGKVSFSGTFDTDVSVSLHANGYYSGENAVSVVNGGFAGDIAVGKLARGMYRIMAMSAGDPNEYITGNLRVDGYLFLDSAAYSLETGKITVAGTSSDRDLEVTVRDASNNTILDGAPVICGDDRRFSSEFSLGTTPASDLKVTVSLSSESSVKEERTVPLSKVSTDDDLDISMYVGGSATVHLDVVGCTYADLTVYSEDLQIAKEAFSTETGDIVINGIAIGSTKVVASVGNSVVEFNVTVNEVPPHDSEYTFLLKMHYDTDIADYGTSGLTASDMSDGISLTAVATNAGEALESALNKAGIPCHFWTSDDGSYRYWVDDIMGLGDVHLDGGLWKYWIQYQVVDGKQVYNQMSLGFYTEGGEFHLLYGITEESGQVVRPDDDKPEIPDEYNGTDSQTTVEVKENSDGSTTVIADSTSVIDGTQTASEITTKKNDDGSTTVTEKTTVTNSDGSTSTTSSTTTVAADGTKTTESTVTNSDGSTSTTSSTTTVNADGTKTTESTVTNSDGTSSTITSTVSADGTTTAATATSKDASGKTVQTVETTSTVTDTTVNGVRTTETHKESTVTDASGAETKVSVTETAVKQADGSITVVRTTETTKDGKTVTESAAGSISADGKIHTTVASSDAEIVTTVKADGEGGSYSVSDASVQTALQQQAAVSDAVGTGKDKVIVIASDTGDVSASIGNQAFDSMADDGAILRMTSTQGTMTFGKDTVAGLSSKDNVTLSFVIADRSSMTSAQREVIEAGSTVVSLTATSAGQNIGSDLGGKVIVTVKHAAVDGKTPVAYYVDENGNKTKIAEQRYDAEKEEMTMVLDHFSIYTIVDEGPAGKEIPVAVLIMTAVIVLICLGILLPQVVGKKQ